MYILSGVEVKFKYSSYPVLIQPTLIKEMSVIEEYPKLLNVGASVTLVEMEKALRNQIAIKPGRYSYIIFQILYCKIFRVITLWIYYRLCFIITTEYQTRIFTEIINMLHWFAGKQIRNVAVSNLVYYNFYIYILLVYLLIYFSTVLFFYRLLVEI